MDQDGLIPTLDPDAALMAAAWRDAGIAPLETLSPSEARTLLQQLRAAAAARAPATEPVATVVDLSCPGGDHAIPLRLYHPGPAGMPLPCLVFYHGGGWVLNDLEPHNALCRALAARSGCAIVAVDYRLAPEFPFPAALDDAEAALRHVRSDGAGFGIDRDRLAVGGDSAGGNLAAVMALTARDRDWSWLRAQLLIYPAVDLTLSSASHTFAGDGFAVTGATMRWFRDLYGGAATGWTSDWRASPLRSLTLAGVAPAAIVTAGFDPLRDEGMAYAHRLADAGVRTLHDHYPGQMHGFLSAGLAFPTAPAALARLATWLRGQFFD